MHMLVHNKHLVLNMHSMNIEAYMFLQSCTNTCHRVWHDLWIEQVKTRCFIHMTAHTIKILNLISKCINTVMGVPIVVLTTTVSYILW